MTVGRLLSILAGVVCPWPFLSRARYHLRRARERVARLEWDRDVEVEQLEADVARLTTERDEARAAHAAVTADRDEWRRMYVSVADKIEALHRAAADAFQPAD